MLKKSLIFILCILVVCGTFAVGNIFLNGGSQSNIALAEESQTKIILQIGNAKMTVDDEEMGIDDSGTVPVIKGGRTLLPIRAVVEAMGGTVDWNATTKVVTLTKGSDTILLTIDSIDASLNNQISKLDVAPTIINSRTMLPIRFIAESFGYNVLWDASTQEITMVSKIETTPTDAVTPSQSEAATVYMTTEITLESLIEIYNALGKTVSGDVAVKMSTGEPPNSNYLRPELISGLVRLVDGTVVESNTAYGGARSSTASHLQVIKDHGLNIVRDADIMDADGEISLPVVGGEVLTENFVGKNFANYDSFLVLSHFKGHAMGGFGGAIKNISIGIASASGKSWIHTGGVSNTSPWGGDQTKFLKSMAEAGKSVQDSLDGNILYINVMNNLSIDCDCDGNPSAPDIHDIGILASLDPVALDKACVDLIYAAPGNESFVARMERQEAIVALQHGEKIGLGTQTYKLESIDD